jgi:hypothetical protein
MRPVPEEKRLPLLVGTVVFALVAYVALMLWASKVWSCPPPPCPGYETGDCPPPMPIPGCEPHPMPPQTDCEPPEYHDGPVSTESVTM